MYRVGNESINLFLASLGCFHIYYLNIQKQLVSIFDTAAFFLYKNIWSAIYNIFIEYLVLISSLLLLTVQFYQNLLPSQDLL